MYDVIVVGARCAGSPTAMLLARWGYRVLLVDRARFPSDAARCHFIHAPGVARLKRWELLDKIEDSHCPAIPAVRFDVGPFALTGTPPSVDGVAGPFGPRRMVLDKILIDAAAQAGAEVREGFQVQELLTDGERVIGIQGRSAASRTVTERAIMVIGADGMRSLVARSIQAPIYKSKAGLTCGYFSYWSGVPIQSTLEIYRRPQRVIFAFPTNNNLTCIAIQWPVQSFQMVRADIEGHMMQAIELAPELAERVRGGRREERFLGSGDLPNFYRKPWGPGWALVGDAGYHKDPYAAQGITDAFRDAELLAGAINAGFSGRMSLEAALLDYEQQRNAATLPLYELTCRQAALEAPSPQAMERLQDLRDNPAEAGRFFGVISGTVPVSEFYSVEGEEIWF